LFKSNFHTHSNFSDGSAPPIAYVEEAIRQNFMAIGFSEHAPLPFNHYYMISEEKIAEYIATIKSLSLKYKNIINIYLSLEIDYVPKLSQSFKWFREKFGLDYTIGSIHLVRNPKNNKLWFIDGADIALYDNGLQEAFNGDIKLAVTTYYEQIQQMIKNENPDVIGHLDKIKMNNKNRYFSENETWYKHLSESIIKNIPGNKCIVEVNTRGIYKKRGNELFPGIEILKLLYTNNIPITISSDAHQPDEISGAFNETLILLKDIGFKKIHTFEEKRWISVDI